MPQLHLYVPEKVAAEVARKAKAKGVSVSRYLSELVQQRIATAWPDRYLEQVVGSCQGRRLSRGRQGQLESRASL